MQKTRFVVEGTQPDDTGGSYITADYVAAFDGDEAANIVREARGEDWTLDLVSTFEDHIMREKMILFEMDNMSIQDVEDSWFETKKSLEA